jgi:hypothetical protein
MMIKLQLDEREALAKYARQERRDARNQAAVIIRRELERRGLLAQGQQQPAPAGAQGDHNERR